ncbi:MAG: glycosyltransferase [Flavisolibacter sp.]
MKALLIFPILKDLNPADGILVKNEGIRKGFIQNDVEIDVLEFTSAGVLNDKERIASFSANKWQRIIQYNTAAWKRIGEFVERNNYDLIWFRMPLLQPWITSFIKQVKERKPGCRIILEYGAYPFENELSGAKKWQYRLFRTNYKLAHHFADRVITYSGQKDVDGVPNIPINNGIDVDSIPVVRSSFKDGEVLHCISVSSVKKWHAYERFISGMAEFRSGKIVFHVVGDGPDLQKLKELAKQNSLEEKVIFHGFKTGAALDEIYNQSHLAIGTLGFHRIGLTNSSSLKNREYFARGLPIILSTPDLDMPASLPFVNYVPGDESTIDISEIMRFAKQVYQSPHLNQQIRAYAEQHLSWKSKVADVLAHLQIKTSGATAALQSS